jgi:hypothetical protein
MRGGLSGVFFMGAIVVACGGKIVPDDGTGWATGSSFQSAQCGTTQPPGTTDDSCFGGVIRCENTDGSFECHSFDDPADITRGGEKDEGTKVLENGTLHLQASANEEAAESLRSADPDLYRFRLRMMVSATTHNVTLVRGRVKNKDTAAFELQVVAGTLNACASVGYDPTWTCVPVGPFGPDVWHTIDIEFGLKVTVDCAPPVRLDLGDYTDESPRIASIDYGILRADCPADVHVDIARSER